MRNQNVIGWVRLGLLICLLDVAPAHAFYNPQQGAGGVGGLLAAGFYGSATTNCFAAYDGNGNVAALVNANDGTISANYEYGPFGEVIRMTGLMAFANPFRFSTKYQDNETDLLYYGYRFYNASQGRWVNRDPIEERGGLNLYAFVSNDPIKRIDRSGLIGMGDLHVAECCRVLEVKVTPRKVLVFNAHYPTFDIGTPVNIQIRTTGNNYYGSCSCKHVDNGYFTYTSSAAGSETVPFNNVVHEIPARSYTDQPGLYNAPHDIIGAPWAGTEVFTFDYHMTISVTCNSANSSKSDSAEITGSFTKSVTWNADRTATAK